MNGMTEYKCPNGCDSNFYTTISVPFSAEGWLDIDVKDLQRIALDDAKGGHLRCAECDAVAQCV